MFNITSSKNLHKNKLYQKEKKLPFVIANTLSLFATFAGAAMITGIVFSSLVESDQSPSKGQEDIQLNVEKPPNTWAILVPGVLMTILGTAFSSKFLQDRNSKIRREIENEEKRLEELKEEQEKVTVLLKEIREEIKHKSGFQAELMSSPPTHETFSRLQKANEIESPSSSQEKVKVMKQEGLEKYRKTLSSLRKSYGELPVQNYESELSKAIRKGKEIAFYIPYGEEHEFNSYKNDALSFLHRTVDNLKRKNILFDEPKYYFYQETKEDKYWNGDINSRGQVVILLAPSPCEDVF